MFDAYLDTLRDPSVRDLAWVMGSPGLLDASHRDYHGQVVEDAWCNAQLVTYAPWLAGLDLAPQALHDYIAAHPTRRLGHYFEILLAYWLKHMPDTRLIATNLQVHNGQRTLGEYDFLFNDASGSVCHWESAIKFYLQAEPRPEQRAFIGPGTRDRLDLKLERVFKHQLVLGNSLAGKQALPQGVTLDRSRAFIKGYLFYPAQQRVKIMAAGISAAHLTGWWARHGLDELPQASANNRWLMLPRMRWLSPALLAADAEVMTDAAIRAQLQEHFSASTDAVLLFEMRRVEYGWQEQARGFVVCPSWPVIQIDRP